ncbi:MAG: metallophosphoesterase family protein [Pirellulaceae bacterium]
MRTIAIGDIHGCSQALTALLDAIQPRPNDVIVTLGDYVDRGPDSRGVLEQLIQLGDRCRHKPLLGNHELMMLEALQEDESLDFWLECGGRQTLASYGGSPAAIPASHLDFLRGCRRFHQSPTHIFLHANYFSDVELADQPDLMLFWEHLSFLVPAPHASGKRVIVGHTPQASGEILDLDHVVCIDTYCVGGGWLTALEAETGRIWQADREGALRQR